MSEDKELTKDKIKENLLEGKEFTRKEMLEHLYLVGAGALAVSLTGGGIMEMFLATKPAAAKEAAKLKRKFHYGMVIDTKRCVGCRACVVACKSENKTPPGVYYNTVLEHAISTVEDKPVFMSKPCFHCETPSCTSVCPVSATFKREQDGIVVIDYERCIGCRYCITACPYGARTFDFGENYPQINEKTAYSGVPSPEYNQFRERNIHASPVGNVRKCTFCVHLQDKDGKYSKEEGRWPSCAKTCTGHAIHFGDFNDYYSDVSRLLRERQSIRLKEELGTQPNVYYLL